MPALYELTQTMMRVIDAYNEVTEDEQLEAIEKLLNEIQQKFDEKAIAVVCHVRNTEGDIAAIDMELERLTKMKKSKQKAVEFFNRYVLNNMEALGQKKIETPTMTISVRENPPSVEVENPDLVPDAYKREKVEVLVDKKAILEAFKTKEVGVSGTRIVRKKRLHIK